MFLPRKRTWNHRFPAAQLFCCCRQHFKPQVWFLWMTIHIYDLSLHVWLPVAFLDGCLLKTWSLGLKWRDDVLFISNTHATLTAHHEIRHKTHDHKTYYSFHPAHRLDQYFRSSFPFSKQKEGLILWPASVYRACQSIFYLLISACTCFETDSVLLVLLGQHLHDRLSDKTLKMGLRHYYNSEFYACIL